MTNDFGPGDFVVLAVDMRKRDAIITSCSLAHVRAKTTGWTLMREGLVHLLRDAFSRGDYTMLLCIAHLLERGAEAVALDLTTEQGMVYAITHRQARDEIARMKGSMKIVEAVRGPVLPSATGDLHASFGSGKTRRFH